MWEENRREEIHRIDNLPILKSVIENMFISDNKRTFLIKAKMKIRNFRWS